MHNLVLGLFVGIVILSLVTPLLLLYGFTKEVCVLLLYLIPLTGGIAALAAANVGAVENKPRRGFATPQVSEGENFKGIEGSFVTLSTRNGAVYKGTVNYCDREMIALRNAMRIDVPEPQRVDKLFVNRNEIREIKIEKNQQ